MAYTGWAAIYEIILSTHTSEVIQIYRYVKQFTASRFDPFSAVIEVVFTWINQVAPKKTIGMFSRKKITFYMTLL
jgi:hypothetical protein